MTVCRLRVVESCLWIFVLGGSLCQCGSSSGQKPKNVLLLMVDDLRPELSPFQEDLQHGVHTPHLQRLAERSVVFKRAYVQQAVCAPSRASLLTGRRPDTTHVYDINTSFREKGGDFTTLPQYFKQHGYLALGMGKVFHDSHTTEGVDPLSWSEDFYSSPSEYYKHWSSRTASWTAVPEPEYRQRPLPDQSVMQRAIETLRRLGKNKEEKFFMAVGFRKPHLPFVFPDKYLDYYPLGNVSLPSNPYAPYRMPRIAWQSWRELRAYEDIARLGLTGKVNVTLPDHWTLDLRRAYLSCVTFIDDLVGQVLEELERQGLADSTIVAFLSDHGWMLGEHGGWCKQNNFELSTRVPLMLHIPGTTDQSLVTHKLVELVDVFPTLAEAVGLPVPDVCPQTSSDVAVCREGSSLLPLVDDPDHAWKDRAFSQYQRNDIHIMGYSLRTAHFRYTEWVNFDRDKYQPNWVASPKGVELYDHRRDPDENVNVAQDPSYQDVVAELKTALRLGWRAAL